jgi:predicted MFS family arabinose efflux permease
MDNGSSESEVSLYLSIAGMCSCIGRILLGMASNSDNVTEDIVYFGSYVVLGVCTIIIPLNPINLISLLFFCLWIVSQICSDSSNLRSSHHIPENTHSIFSFTVIKFRVPVCTRIRKTKNSQS